MSHRARGLVLGLVVVLAIVSAYGVHTRDRGSAVARSEPAVLDADAGRRVQGESFIAFARDFQGFQSWERLPVEGAMVPTGSEPGPTYVYVNRRPEAHARRWPVGSILVKVIETGPPEDWVIHAMVKRGVPYNLDGTIGWEFFELDLAPGDEVSVVWRGQSPPRGHGYGARGRDAGAAGHVLVCNDCHAANELSDGVLTPALSLER